MATGPASPPGKAKVTDIEGFKWKNIFQPSFGLHDSYDAVCTSKREFGGTSYTLHDLFTPQPKGLLNWAESLKQFLGGREYPGDWEGKDPHQYNRHILMMTYSDVPIAVREWIEFQAIQGTEAKDLFLVYPMPANKNNKVREPINFKTGEINRATDKEKVVLFAPGAVYDILPLWVAEDSDCKETLLDLSKYAEEPADGAVVAWTITHTEPNMSGPSRDMKFTIKAEALAKKDIIKEEVAEIKSADETAEEKPMEEIKSKDEL